jgi:transmembrane sensor
MGMVDFDPSTPSPETIGRFFSGVCSPDESDAVRAWSGMAPDGTPVADMVHALVLVQNVSPNADDEGTLMWSRLQPTLVPEERAVRKRFLLVGRKLVAIVATVAACAIIAAMLTLLRPKSTATHDRTYATRPGERTTVQLADGSRIALGPGTTLRVSKTATAMELTIDGSALVMARHQTDAPLTVRTRVATIRVLGTTFSVQQMGSSTTRVAVTEGRVSVTGTPTSDVAHVLESGRVAIIDDSGRVTMRKTFVAAEDTAWAEGRLEYHDAPVRDIVADLVRIYGINIRVTDSALAASRITWTVRTTRYSLSEVLAELPILFDVHVARVGNTITILPGRRPFPRSKISYPTPSQENQYGR